ncbi:pituitary tumor-transforming gene 1 protein-interacting protein [Rhinatrema bivittatum]|uniref:pituitary tumor-transforming gene 1 protein-interacting protein n=1 Tax=Rhinatrema bivittatum TaxID=194408 RepID=UPI00112AB9E9|nr:pituitary tumor-transforming gene 1 protein-interacting protein [Rhinatrema bivittatum]XP_029462030.1 pituitary tumor-transforming gene 1 protein-interacting protein [Rhinatrema bivittatum]
MLGVGLGGRWLPAALCGLSALGLALAAPDAGCSKYTNTSCEQCLSNVTCLWCSSTNECLVYPVRNILPPSSLCKLNAARWGVCWVNFEALIIAMSVVGGVLIIGLCVCCWCCCCRKKKSRKPDKEDEKAARQNEQRRVRQEERRAEMKSRHDEIRKKYGLFKENNAYTKFEN